MKIQYSIVVVFTILIIISYLLQKQLAICYPGFSIDSKTPGDGCDLQYTLLRIGILPQLLLGLLGILAFIGIKKYRV